MKGVSYAIQQTAQPGKFRGPVIPNITHTHRQKEK
jgi:hypothetical protein